MTSWKCLIAAKQRSNSSLHSSESANSPQLCLQASVKQKEKKGRRTNLTEHLPGLGLVKEPHDDAGVLPLCQSTNRDHYISFMTDLTVWFSAASLSVIFSVKPFPGRGIQRLCLTKKAEPVCLFYPIRPDISGITKWDRPVHKALSTVFLHQMYKQTSEYGTSLPRNHSTLFKKM